LTSKIINMADKFRDAEDRLLETMFDSEPITDNGFSDNIIRRIRRRIWIRRLTLPTAILIGGAIAMKPALQLIVIVSRLLSIVPNDLLAAPVTAIPQLPIVLLGAMLLVIGMLSIRMLEE